MENFRFILQTEYLGNSVQNYLIFIVAIILGLLFKGLISKYLSHSLYKIIGTKETRVGVEKFDELLTRPIGFVIMLSVLFFWYSAFSIVWVTNVFALKVWNFTKSAPDSAAVSIIFFAVLTDPLWLTPASAMMVVINFINL